VSASYSASISVLFYRDYLRNTCSFTQYHYGLLRGERKWLRHICADCWVMGNTSMIRRSALFLLALGQKLISSRTFVHLADFSEGASPTDCSVSEVSEHDILV